MEGSRERVRAMLRGEVPDRPPLYELIRNDVVVEYFTGQRLTVENGEELLYRTFPVAVDATRPKLKTPQHKFKRIRPDGRRQVQQRWTSWTEHKRYPSTEAYVAAKRQTLNGSWEWTERDQAGLARHLPRTMPCTKI